MQWRGLPYSVVCSKKAGFSLTKTNNQACDIEFEESGNQDLWQLIVSTPER
jgi:hypothetical protein